MKIKGIFYLNSGAVHTETLRIRRYEKKATVRWIDDFLKKYEDSKFDNEYCLHYGDFYCKVKDIIAIKFKM